MNTERWERIQDLFHRTVDLPEDERTRVLDAECAGDTVLLEEVRALLHGDAGVETLLDKDVSHVAHAMLNADTVALPSDSFGPYRLTRSLGEGGMGVVYLALRADLGSVAAIKILRDAWLSPARRERFLGEQRTLAQLNHPNIARLFDAGTLADGTPWIAMEYVEGVPLSEYCRTRGAGVGERLRLIRDVGEAVLHAHQSLVVHRDLKPSNVLVRQDGTVKLLDFGIAKQLETLEGSTDTTRTGLRLMTPAYAAPEQIAGGRVGIHTDVYSLGVMLYELLTGQLPHDLSDKTPGQAETIILEQNPERPSIRAAASAAAGTAVTVTRAQWADLDVLCLTAMHKDPQRRYRSVDALIRDIDHFTKGEPLDARPDSARYRLEKFARRNARTLTATAAVAMVGIGLVTFYTFRLNAARNAALAETVRTQRIQRFMTNLFQGGDETTGPADSLRVVTLLDQGVREAQSLDEEPVAQADLYNTLGVIFQQLGRYERADSLLRIGLEQRRRLAGATSTDAARSLVALGALRVEQARYVEADTLLRQGLATLQRALPDGDEVIADARMTRAKGLNERGEHRTAIAVMDSVLAQLERSGKETTALMLALSELANAHFYAGNYSTADSLNLRALAITRRLNGARHALVAEDLINLGATKEQRGLYDEAEKYYREGLDITRAFYGDDHYKTAGNLSALGQLLMFKKEYAEAQSVLDHALLIRERVLGPTHPSVATTLNALAGVAGAQGNSKAAEAAYLRALQIYRAAYPGQNYRVGVASGNLASVYMEEKEYAKAEALFREALTIYLATQGPDHLNTGIGRIKLGRVLMRQGKLVDAERETLAGHGIVTRITEPGNGFLQAARLDLSLMYDSLGQPDKASKYRAERQQYLPKPVAASAPR
ncbi:MAG: tetratricopeptide repeat protein [Gemmatimonadaceae bacterium]